MTASTHTRGSSALLRLQQRWFPKQAGKSVNIADALGGAFVSRSYMVAPGQPVWMSRDYTQFAQEAFVRNVVAHRAMTMVAQAASSIPWTAYRQRVRGARQEIKTHPMLQLLERPNPQQTRQEWIEAIVMYRMISGNAFIQAVGPRDESPRELHLLRPDRVAVIAGKNALPAAYRYSVGETYIDYPVDRITGRARVLHLKTFHPLNDWYGLSPVEAAAYSIDQHNQSAAWNQALLQNGARPSGALVVKTGDSGLPVMSEEQYTRVKQQLDDQFAGAANAGRPLLLEGGLDWKEMSLTPKDMDFVQAKHSAARDIALAFGVPPQLLGIPGDNTYSNLQEARTALWEQTVIPLTEQLAASIGQWLSSLFGETVEFVPDTDAVMALAMRNQAIWERVEKASFLTTDEKRAAVGYPPLSQGQM